MLKMTRIKDNIEKEEFEHLLRYLEVDTQIRQLRKDRLNKIFNILYITGLRINEATQLTTTDMIELLREKELKVISFKQRIEKKIYITERGKKQLEKVFINLVQDNTPLFVSERGSKKTILESNSVVRDVNSYLKKVFPHKNITSHSFRQTLITELSEEGINMKIVQELIGHKSISSTYRYYKPSQKSIKDSLSTIR